MGGGGFGAVPLGMYYSMCMVRAYQTAGIFGDVKYIASNSGGSWLLGRGDPPWDVGFVRPAKKGTCVCYLGPPVGRHIAELASANCLGKIYLFIIFFKSNDF